MGALQLIAVGCVFIKPLISLSLEMFKLLHFGHRFRNARGVFLIKQEELLFVVGMDGLDLVHEGVEEHMLLEVSLQSVY